MQVLSALASHYDFDLDVRFKKLPAKIKDVIKEMLVKQGTM